MEGNIMGFFLMGISLEKEFETYMLFIFFLLLTNKQITLNTFKIIRK